MRGYRVTFIRHGLTDANDRGIYIGKTDMPLSESGRQAVIEAKETRDYPEVRRVFSSPLLRCIETAQLLFPKTRIEGIEELCEMDLGVFENKTTEELQQMPAYHKWLKGGLDNAPPEGESLRHVMERCYSGLNEILFQMMEDDLHHCACVTHSGIIMNALSAFGLPKYKPFELSCAPCEGFDVLFTAEMWQRSGAFEILGRVPYVSGDVTDTDEDDTYAEDDDE